MNNRYAIYTSASGEIQFSVNANADEVAAAHCELDHSFVRATRPFSSRDYVNLDTGNINQRPMTPCTYKQSVIPSDGATKLKLSQMRPDTVVVVSGPDSGSMTCSGTDSITFTTPGQYQITATAPFPAMPKKFSITVT